MDEAYVERVLSAIETVPAGRVTTYGWIAAAVGDGGPRRVARVMSGYGSAVPWWRVVRAGGRLPPGLEDDARAHLAAEGVLAPGDRVDLDAVGVRPTVSHPSARVDPPWTPP